MDLSDQLDVFFLVYLIIHLKSGRRLVAFVVFSVEKLDQFTLIRMLAITKVSWSLMWIVYTRVNVQSLGVLSSTFMFQPVGVLSSSLMESGL